MRKQLFVGAMAIAVAVTGFAVAGISGRGGADLAWAGAPLIDTDTIEEPFVQLNDRELSPRGPQDTFTIRGRVYINSGEDPIAAALANGATSTVYQGAGSPSGSLGIEVDTFTWTSSQCKTAKGGLSLFCRDSVSNSSFRLRGTQARPTSFRVNTVVRKRDFSPGKPFDLPLAGEVSVGSPSSASGSFIWDGTPDAVYCSVTQNGERTTCRSSAFVAWDRETSVGRQAATTGSIGVAIPISRSIKAATSRPASRRRRGPWHRRPAPRAGGAGGARRTRTSSVSSTSCLSIPPGPRGSRTTRRSDLSLQTGIATGPQRSSRAAEPGSPRASGSLLPVVGVLGAHREAVEVEAETLADRAGFESEVGTQVVVHPAVKPARIRCHERVEPRACGGGHR